MPLYWNSSGLLGNGLGYGGRGRIYARSVSADVHLSSGRRNAPLEPRELLNHRHGAGLMSSHNQSPVAGLWRLTAAVWIALAGDSLGTVMTRMATPHTRCAQRDGGLYQSSKSVSGWWYVLRHRMRALNYPRRGRVYSARYTCMGILHIELPDKEFYNGDNHSHLVRVCAATLQPARCQRLHHKPQRKSAGKARVFPQRSYSIQPPRRPFPVFFMGRVASDNMSNTDVLTKVGMRDLEMIVDIVNRIQVRAEISPSITYRTRACSTCHHHTAEPPQRNRTGAATDYLMNGGSSWMHRWVSMRIAKDSKSMEGSLGTRRLGRARARWPPHF